MGIFAARARPVVIHAAMIVRKKKGTWRRDHHIVAVLVKAKVFRNKDRWPHPETPRQAFDITLVEDGTRSLAAVGAFQAMGGSKNLVVKAVNGGVELTRIGFLQRAQEFPVFLVPAGGEKSVSL